MRYTLEQLKAMSDVDLKNAWIRADFPFETIDCGRCMTMHSEAGQCDHVELKKQIIALPKNGYFHGINFAENLRSNLEELYALRLFYDHLYQQPAEAQADREFERIEEDHYDARANTRE